MDNDIKRKKRAIAKRPKVWQDIVVQKPPAPKVEVPQKKAPKFKFPKLPKLPTFSRSLKVKKLRVSKKSLLFVTIVVLLASCSAAYYFSNNRQTLITNKGNKAYKVTKLETGTPTYPTITPNDKKTTWTKISPPGADSAIYAYVDKINGISISVTEQPLPDEFKTETSYKIEKLAKDYDASVKLTAGDVHIYVGTSVRDSMQSVIFTKSNLLIMIKSKNIIDNQDWVNYVNSMR